MAGSRQADSDKADKSDKSDKGGQQEERWDYFLVEADKVGYLRLSTFTEGSINQVKTALQKLEAASVAGLILDLRGNGGGLLTAATAISDLFIDEGVLLTSKGRAEKTAQWLATKGDCRRSYPLVILINGGSASASEIVAGVLGHQGYHRAVLVGDRTFGKGSVQEVMSLGVGKGKLKFTAGHYYLPNGQPVGNRDSLKRQGRDDWGIAADVSVPLYAFEGRQIREAYRRRGDDSDAADGDTEAKSANELLLAADPQLATALLVLKARMAVGR